MAFSARELADRAAAVMADKKATDVRILDLQGLTTIVDYFVICAAESEPQMRAILDAIREDLELDAIKPWHIEGITAWKWVLLDYVDVVVHVFRPDTREFYGLERLWGDAPTTMVSVDPESGQVKQHVLEPPVRHEDVDEPS